MNPVNLNNDNQIEHQTNPCTKKEDTALMNGVEMYGRKWSSTPKPPSEAGQQFRLRYGHSLDSEIKLGKWSDEEDAALIKGVNEHGNKWSLIAESLPGRNWKQCHRHYTSVLDPNLKHTRWSDEEDAVLIEGVNEHGHKWSLIAKRLPGRSDAQCHRRYTHTLDPNRKHTKQLGNVAIKVLKKRKREEGSLNATQISPEENPSKTARIEVSSDEIQKINEEFVSNFFAQHNLAY
jgi:hypothetical protein